MQKPFELKQVGVLGNGSCVGAVNLAVIIVGVCNGDVRLMLKTHYANLPQIIKTA